MQFESAYPLAPLSELVEFINGDRSSNYPGPDDYEANGVPFISATDVGNGRVNLGSVKRISRLAFGRLRSGQVRRGDILLCIRGSLGKLGVVRDFDEGAIASSLVILRASNLTVLRYLRYALSGAAGASLLESLDNGSVQGNISVASLRGMPIPLPPKNMIEAIASLMTQLDDRIDLLAQTNATLEAIAQALFKSWFIDFDPVRAKSEGREPEGMDAATAALFPAEFEDSPLGAIPRGWRLSTLAEYVHAERGLSYKGAGLRDAGEGLPMHNLNSVLEGGGYKYAGIKHYAGDYKERHLALAGDIIVANTEQGHDHRLIGFPAIVPARYPSGIYSHHIYRVRPKSSSPLTTQTLYYTLMAPTVREQIIGCANGSTVNMLKVAGLEIPQFVCPTAEIATAFERVAAPIRTQIEAQVERAEVLGALRDTLLPRLISGKLRLPDARAQLEEALA